MRKDTRLSAGVLDLHVRESNAIEGIGGEWNFLRQRWDDPYVPPCYLHGHLQAAGFVASDPAAALDDPRKVHARLFMPIDRRHAGRYRTDALMRVGERIMPHPRHVEALMADWIGCVQGFMRDTGFASLPEDKAHSALMLHNMFLCIHPFEDGNGRTARLLYNAVRLLSGLDWLVIRACNSDHYMDQLEVYEDTVFRPRYAHVYP
jgi:hypothetical protein